MSAVRGAAKGKENVYSSLCRFRAALCCSLLAVALAACGGGGRSGVVPNAGVVADSGLAANDTTLVTAATAKSTSLTEMPRRAASFADSVGVNVHLGYYWTRYSDITAVQNLLTGLGIRHIRDGISPGWTNLCSEFSQLGAHGIRGDFIVGSWMSPTDVTTWDSCTGRTADAYEGLNEWDISHPATDTNWPQTDASVQQSLYSTVKAMRPVTVFAPSLTSESAYAALGSVAATSDVGNAHVYFAARNPGTTGWGAGDSFGVYGSLKYDLAIARQTTGTKPIVVTETGYGDTSDTVYVPPATKARYTLRTLLEAWNAKLSRTYLYELIDEGGGYFGSYGLADGNGNVKPAYTAVKNLLAHLSDPGRAVTLRSLAYTLAAPAQVHHALFEKRDGSFVLALWLEVSEWDPNANVPIAVAPQATVLTFGRVPSMLRTTSFDDGGNVTTQALAQSGAVTLSVGGSPTLLDIMP
ncbi:MAG: hypothetical protein JWN27_2547 [Candidatus Eremiobacteraeota bacterium]|nr:hypothetical protein [Candidatus Eremiobacteraeota bacterium]